VPDSAIGHEGRTVRCAKCRHSWFQEPAELVAETEAATTVPAAPAPPPPPPPPVPAPEPTTAEPEPAGAPAAETPAAEPDLPPPPAFEAPPTGLGGPEPRESQFEAAPPFRRRANPLRLLTWASAIFAAMAAGLIGAVSWWGLPDWVPVSGPTFAEAPLGLELAFPPEEQERRQLPNGTEYFGASGTITNTGATSQTVPPILIVLRDARERVVYSWEVQPPKRTLAPGESVTVNEAVTDVPRSARFAEISWKPG
jgi:hypothetical protein